MRDLWNSLNEKSTFGFISHLQQGQQWHQAEFHLTAIRFSERMCERFSDYGIVELSQANLLVPETTCLSLQRVCGVDLSEKMLESAKNYCACLPNVELQIND
jgi:hypothetical protein